MKAITILQPWATLIALGEKRFETRSWSTAHRGELAIHAGKKIDREACEREPIKSTLANWGYTADNLPTGAIVAIAMLGDCKEIHIDHTGDAVLLAANKSPRVWIGKDSNEYHFGFYAPQRYAWELMDVRQQRLWNWEAPNNA